MIHKITTCCLLLLYAATGSAQNFSQDWANYNSYLDVAKDVQTEGQVHEFSGAVNYSFVLHSLQAEGQSFPVSINYFSSGVKVDEYASAVGLGWNLNAGGCITKITRGLDDNSPGGYNNVGESSPTVHKQVIYGGTRDGEKDYYVFNAFGLSGSFIYHKPTNRFIPMNGEKVEIMYSTSPSPNFTIKDHNGNSYYFTIQETIYTYQGFNLLNAVSGNWFLTRVTTAHNKEINLTYEAKNIPRFRTSFSEMDPESGSAVCVPQFNHTVLAIDNSYESYRLTSISSTNETLSFTYDTRTDLGGDKALTKVEVSRNNVLLKRYLLNHSYLSGRLMLDAVVDKNYSTGAETRLLNFDYYSTLSMPLPASVQSQDAAGYFNNAGAYSYIQNNTTPYTSLLPVTNGSGANRSIASADIVCTLMLKKVTNHYGKIQEFLYENNYYGTSLGYGVRVAKTVSYDHTQPAKKRYTRYLYQDESGVPTGVRTNTLGDLTIPANDGTCEGIVRKSVSGSYLARIVDYLGVYTKVKVQVYTDDNDISTSSLGYTVNEYNIDPDVIDHSSGTPVWTVSKYKWGLINSSRSYNIADQLVDETVYTYYFAPYGQWVNVNVYLKRMLSSTAAGLAVQTYELNVGIPLLTESLHKTYSPTADLLLTEKKMYTYDALNYVSQVDVYRNNVLKESTTFKRPQQFTLTPGSTDPVVRAVQELSARKIYSPVLETVTTRKDVSPAVVVAASADVYTYDFTRNIILPGSSYEHRAVDPSVQAFSPLSFPGDKLSLSGTYAQTQEILAFDDIYPAEVKANKLEYSSTYYTREGNSYCSFANVALNHTAFMGFEQEETNKAGRDHVVQSGWEMVNCSPGAQVQTAFTGTRFFNLSGCTNTSLRLTRSLDPARQYRLQFWQKKGSGTAVADVSSTPKVILSTSAWQLVEYLVQNETGIIITGTAIIDDVRLFPVEASCSYATYNELGLKTAECDNTGQCVFYEYDEYYRLLTIKDMRGSMLKRFEYGIQEQQ